MEDKYRDRILDEKLKGYYDTILRQSIDYIPKNKRKTFKHQLQRKLNSAFMHGKQTSIEILKDYMEVY